MYKFSRVACTLLLCFCLIGCHAAPGSECSDVPFSPASSEATQPTDTDSSDVTDDPTTENTDADATTNTNSTTALGSTPKAPTTTTKNVTKSTAAKKTKSATTTTVPQIVVGGDDPVHIDTPDINTSVDVDSAHKPISPSSYYQYSSLSAKEKKVYDRIAQSVAKADNTVDLADLDIKKEDACVVLHRYMADRPQDFWLAHSYYVSATKEDDKMVQFFLSYTDGKIKDEYDTSGHLTKQADRSKISKQITEFNSAIKAILKKIPTSGSQLQKEKAIHDYLTATLTYDNETAANYTEDDNVVLPRAFDAYGAAINHKAVCEGYAKLFQYLCTCVGINATQVHGVAGETTHVWNAVQIDGNWYFIDVTWDDAEDEKDILQRNYFYFNGSATDFSAHHKILKTNLALPTCNSNKASFYNHYAVVVNSADAAPTNIEKAVDAMVASNDNFLYIYYAKSGALPANYIQNHVISPQAPLNKYLAKKSLTLTGNSYGFGSYTIIELKAKK